ncbi:hypothetical protein H2199_009194 [Coniosporium tulheliwenetii]|uniref:Uncharacterized protein n=1 Tax=Coniosporium tulheliwenetii TaxID=3383036 RepID=A0ACC2YFL9_9PEZI|nr:hypothetical protein H2199_009194 [Cladosporium sp. JES 115]
MPTSLHLLLPWAAKPLITNAPMGFFAGGSLAAAVTSAGGMGFIGAVYDMAALDRELSKAASALSTSPNFENSRTKEGLLPVGVGFLPFAVKVEDALPVIEKWRPHSVWLFAAREHSDYTAWAERIRATTEGKTLVWIQTGSVSAGVEVARLVHPDVLVLQGSDAGGHGFEKGAGIISLLPEAADALADAGFGDIPLVAAGGIAEARGVAAALALGAQGVVMGTRFLASKEAIMPHPVYQEAILETLDGGQSTVRTKLFDNLSGPNVWPEAYDGRGVVTQTWRDHVNGMSLEEIRKLHKEAEGREDKGYGLNGRVTMWAGTGVGLVREVKGAGEVAAGVREEARRVVEGLRTGI